jgi:hypothetical protein
MMYGERYFALIFSFDFAGHSSSMSAQRLVGTIFLLVAAIIYRFNEENKMAMFIMWMYILFGLAAMIHFQPKRLDLKGKAVFVTGCDTGRL